MVIGVAALQELDTSPEIIALLKFPKGSWMLWFPDVLWVVYNCNPHVVQGSIRLLKSVQTALSLRLTEPKPSPKPIG
jgi:hypothetical protein